MRARRPDSWVGNAADSEQDKTKNTQRSITCISCSPTAFGVVLCTSNDIPDSMRRPFIFSCYRPQLRSVRECLTSLFYLHNETVNIWSHLLGGLIVGYHAVVVGMDAINSKTPVLDLSFEQSLDPSLPRGTLEIGRCVHSAFLFAAANCFLTSAAYHCGSCYHDEALCASLFRADVTGIAVLIAASFLPGVFFGFACFPFLQHAYLVMVAGLLIVGVGVSLFDCEKSRLKTHGAQKDTTGKSGVAVTAAQRVRTAVFVCFVCLGLVVAVHWALLVAAPARALFLPRVVGMLALYGSGFAVYSSQQPERGTRDTHEEGLVIKGTPVVANDGIIVGPFSPPQPPGRYDVWGHSHQWWHLAVVAAVLVWHSTCVGVRIQLQEEGCRAYAITPGVNGLNLRGGVQQSLKIHTAV
mmetsp:Transcript_49929/g.98638  ORF Transcript_49929/g.98638 Transcript_49929/m.98638 type:complete len:410 (+) Transcript_49929:122-1351(+)